GGLGECFGGGPVSQLVWPLSGARSRGQESSARRGIQDSPRRPRGGIGFASCLPRQRRGSARVAARRHRAAHAALGREETMRVGGLFLLLSAAWAASAAAESCYTVRPSDGQVTYKVSQAG